jgi:hypothetical protein
VIPAAAIKRDALCAVIERSCEAAKLDLHLHAVAILGLVETFHPLLWEQMARDCTPPQEPPSEAEIELVKDRFRARVTDTPRVPWLPPANDARWGR